MSCCSRFCHNPRREEYTIIFFVSFTELLLFDRSRAWCFTVMDANALAWLRHSGALHIVAVDTSSIMLACSCIAAALVAAGLEIGGRLSLLLSLGLALVT